MNANGIPAAVAALVVGLLAWIFADRVAEFGEGSSKQPKDRRQAVLVIRAVALTSIPFALFAIFVVG